MLFCELERSNRNYLGRLGCELCILLWSILKDIFKTDLSYLLSLVFVSLVLFLSTYCFPVLIFCFYLYLNLCLAREFTYCHIRNVIRLASFRCRPVFYRWSCLWCQTILGSLVLVSCGYAQANLFPNNIVLIIES